MTNEIFAFAHDDPDEDIDDLEDEELDEDDADSDEDPEEDVVCPECSEEIEEEIVRGDVVTCPGCDRRLEVLDINPPHLIVVVEKEMTVTEGVQDDRVLGERRPITNTDDDGKLPIVGTEQVGRTQKGRGTRSLVRDRAPYGSIDAVPPSAEVPSQTLSLPSAKEFLDSHSTDAIADGAKREDEIFDSGDPVRILRVIDSIVRNAFRRQQLISKIRKPNDQINRILDEVIREVQAGKKFTSQEMRQRLECEVQAIYDNSPARQKFYDRAPDGSELTSSPFSLLPRARRHPGGGRSAGTYGLDSDAREVLDEYEALAAQASAAVASGRGEKEHAPTISSMGKGPERGDPEKSDDAEPTDRSKRVEVTWENFAQLGNEDWVIRLRQPSLLQRMAKFIQAALDILQEKDWQAELVLAEKDPKTKAALADEFDISARPERLEKRGPSGEVMLRGVEAAGMRGLNKALAQKLRITERDVDTLWREIKTLKAKHSKASEVLERVPRQRY